MTFTSLFAIGVFAATVAGLPRLAPRFHQGVGQPPQGTDSWPAATKGVQCPNEFETLFDASTKVLRCRREVVAWVVTNCPDKEFATYAAKAGPDSCGRTEIPGVGTPPGTNASRPVACATSGYSVVLDRTGQRDRCERVDQLFAYPRPVP